MFFFETRDSCEVCISHYYYQISLKHKIRIDVAHPAFKPYAADLIDMHVYKRRTDLWMWRRKCLQRNILRKPIANM